MNWSLELEYVSALILAIVYFYSNAPGARSLIQYRLFRRCIQLAFLGVAANISACLMMEDFYRWPLWIHYLINTLFFLMTGLMVLHMFAYMLFIVYRNRPGYRGYYVAFGVLWALFGMYAGLIILNLWTGVVFRFEVGTDWNYVRGPANICLYLLLLFNLALLLICFMRNRSRIDRNARTMMWALPCTALVLGSVQQILPHVMMSGFVMGISALIIFLQFQSNKIHVDEKTGLSTRDVYYQLLSSLIEKKKPYRIWMLSLQNFKTVNEHVGIYGGDRILGQIGDLFKQECQDAVACRYSNVLFAVIFEGKSLKKADACAARILERFSSCWEVDGRREMLMVRAADIDSGIPVADVSQLSHYLESALRIQQKDSGQITVHFSRQQLEKLQREKELLRLIREGLDQNRFFLCYQPIYDCRSRRFLSAEALLRLRDENGNVVSPAEFIPVAEENGLVEELTWKVLDMACAFLSRNSRELEYVSVNLPPEHFMQPDLVEKCGEIFARHRVPPGCLRMEITERTLLRQSKPVLDRIDALIRNGVQFFLDDFGIGYSNLAYALTVPFSCVKIDKSLVDHVVDDPNVHVLMEAIVQSFHVMGLSVVTEGVETRSQMLALEKMRVDKIQGYYFSKPLPEEELLLLLHQKRGESE